MLPFFREEKKITFQLVSKKLSQAQMLLYCHVSKCLGDRMS